MESNVLFPTPQPIVPQDGFFERTGNTLKLISGAFRAKSGGVKERGRFLAHLSATLIRKYPFYSVAGAAAIGLVTGIILKSGGSSKRITVVRAN